MAEIIDTRGKKSINCPYCNAEVAVPLREISVEKLKHMQELNVYTEWRRKIEVNGGFIMNGRLIECPNCHKIIPIADIFTKINP